MDSFALPSASSTIAGIGAYASPLVTEYLPVAFFVIGLTVAGLAIMFVARKGSGLGRMILKGGRRRGRR